MTDVAQGWVANAPTTVHSEAAGSTALAPSVGVAGHLGSNDKRPRIHSMT